MKVITVISLLNGVQIPETAVKQTIEASVDKFYASDIIRWVQYDDTIPIVAVDLQYEDQHWNIPDGATLKVRMKKPDKHTVLNDVMGVDESGIVYFAATRQMTAAWGKGTIVIEVDSSGTKNSANITVMIEENPVKDDDMQSKDEYKSLERILEEAKKAAAIVSANANNLQILADNLEAVKNAGDNAVRAEAAAEKAKEEAQKALGFRTIFGTVIPDANGDLDPSRPMNTPTAQESWTIKSKGDRIQSVQVNGFTQQAGSGDASPVNVRDISTAGTQANLFPGFTQLASRDNATGELVPQSNSNVSSDIFEITPGQSYYISVKTSASIALSTWFWDSNGDFIKKISIVSGAVNPAGTFTAPENAAKMAVSAYMAGSNLESYTEQLIAFGKQPVPYTPYTGARFGAVVGLAGHETVYACLPLTEALGAGDKVESNVPSGCDKRIVLDGTESFALAESPGNVFQNYNLLANSENFTAICNDYTPGGNSWAAMPDKSVLNSSNILGFRDSECKTAEGFKAMLAARYAAGNPVVVWYRSVAYTEANDIPVALETHAKCYHVFDGTENIVGYTDLGTVARVFVKDMPSIPAKYAGCICNVFKTDTAYTGDYEHCYANKEPYFFIDKSRLSEQSSVGVKNYFASLYSSGTPIVMVYELATPAVYAHDPVELVAVPYTDSDATAANQLAATPSTLPYFDSADVPMLLDSIGMPEPDVTVQSDGTLDAENTQKAAEWVQETAQRLMAAPLASAPPVAGTYVVSSQDGTTVLVSLKAMQDGGDAATLGGMTLDDIKALISSMIADANK